MPLNDDMGFALGIIVNGVRDRCETPEEEVREFRRLLEKAKKNPNQSKRYLAELEHCLADAEYRVGAEKESSRTDDESPRQFTRFANGVVEPRAIRKIQVAAQFSDRRQQEVETKQTCPNCQHNDGEIIERDDGTEACDKCSIPCPKCGSYTDPERFDEEHGACERCSPNGEHRTKRRHLKAFVEELRKRKAKMPPS